MWHPVKLQEHATIDTSTEMMPRTTLKGKGTAKVYGSHQSPSPSGKCAMRSLTQPNRSCQFWGLRVKQHCTRVNETAVPFWVLHSGGDDKNGRELVSVLMKGFKREGSARESITPFPIWVSQKGSPVESTSWRSMLLVILRFAPAPITSSGCLAACMHSSITTVIINVT